MSHIARERETQLTMTVSKNEYLHNNGEFPLPLGLKRKKNGGCRNIFKCKLPFQIEKKNAVLKYFFYIKGGGKGVSTCTLQDSHNNLSRPSRVPREEGLRQHCEPPP